jgi:hypothetical protein
LTKREYVEYQNVRRERVGGEHKNMIIKGYIQVVQKKKGVYTSIKVVALQLQLVCLPNEAVKYKGNLLDYRIFLRTPSRTIFCTTVLLISTDFNPAMEPLCS